MISNYSRQCVEAAELAEVAPGISGEKTRQFFGNVWDLWRNLAGAGGRKGGRVPEFMDFFRIRVKNGKEYGILGYHFWAFNARIGRGLPQMKTALVILAAGIGARYGGGIKQLEPVGPNGEIIMDYSIHDAIAAGFSKVVFIIRKSIAEDFQAVIGNRIEETCRRLGVEVAYAYQELEDMPDGMTPPPERKKPWGTGQALLACRDVLHEPFAVINADDYYGKEAFGRLYCLFAAV